jgi:Fic family protein
LKIPDKAPSLNEPFGQLKFPDLIAKTRDLVKKSNNEYLYWDNFRDQPMPEGVTSEEAWAVLKLSRLMQMKYIPLTDSKWQSFGYWLPDSVLQEIHFIEQQAGAAMLANVPLNHAEETRYMTRSLMEEAISSSQIEGATTTQVAAREMLRTGRQPEDRSEWMIYNNYLALRMIRKRLEEPLSPGLIQEIHALITKDTLEDPSRAGRFRLLSDEINHVFDMDGHTILHTPPKADVIPALMQAVCDYTNNNEKDEIVGPLIKGILLHFQLAYISPFLDGNGRTARALFYWYMLKHNYRLFEFLSISAAILLTCNRYHGTFLYSEIDDNDATYFIAYKLGVIHSSVELLKEYAEKKQGEILRVSRLAAKYRSLNFRQRALLASALEKPRELFSIEAHSVIHGTTYQTARTDLLGLKALGLLEMRKAGRKFVFMPVRDLANSLNAMQ